ncbi:hypothetical protein Tco_0787922 [Tanacetum coccineum]
MSDSEHSTVTYTSISGDDGSLDLGSPGVIVLGYDRLPMMPEDPYPYPPEDDVLPAEKQPLPAAVLPIADSPGYITESDPEEHPKEDVEDPEEDPADYPADRYDEEEESSGDDADDEDEEESYPLFGYKSAMTVVRSQSQSNFPFQHTKPPPIVLPHTRASIVMMRAAAPSTYILAPRSETPPSGTPLLLPIPLPTSSPPLLFPSTNCRADVLEVTLSPWKRFCIYLGPRYKVGECSSAPTARPTGGFRVDYGFVGTLDAKIRHDLDREIGYGITDVWEDPDEIAEEIPTTDVAELGQRMTDFVTTVRQDTDEIYGRLEDAHDDRLLMSGQLNLLHRDRRSHARTARLMKSEARASREAWVQSMDASDMTRSEVRALRTTVLAQQTEIGDLWAADCRRKAQLAEALSLLRTLQTQMVALQSQQRPARDPTHSDVPEVAGSSS